MTIDVYTSTGIKKGTVTLPEALFGATINMGLMHQAVVRVQGSRRAAIAHTKSRGEIRGSTRKVYQQKGTGRARRGSVRSPILRGGNKAFGPSKLANFSREMPRKMRRAALRSSLSAQAKAAAIIGLESYPDEAKTKTAIAMLKKMPVQIGRHIVIVMPGKHVALMRAVRNIPNVRTVIVQYLNPEDILGARHIVFMVEALGKAEEVFGGGSGEAKPKALKAEKALKAPKALKAEKALKAKKDEKEESSRASTASTASTASKN